MPEQKELQPGRSSDESARSNVEKLWREIGGVSSEPVREISTNDVQILEPKLVGSEEQSKGEQLQPEKNIGRLRPLDSGFANRIVKKRNSDRQAA